MLLFHAMGRRPEEIFPKENQLNITLSSNPTLESVAQALRETPMDKPGVREAALGELSRHVESSTENSLYGRLAEIHVEQVVSKLNSDAVSRYSPETKKISGKFHLVEDPHEVLVARRASFNSLGWKEEITDYDGLIICEDLPTIIEVRMSSREDGIKNILHRNTINRKFLPLVHHFNRVQFGYVAVVPAGVIREDDYTKQRFISDGGIYVELPASITPDFLRQESKSISQAHRESEPKSWIFE